MGGPITPGILGWIYDYQNLVAGLLALGAGVLAYLAGKHQATVMRSVAADQIKAATEAHDTQRRDDAEKLVNTVSNIASQIQFEAAVLQRFMEIAIPELDRLEEMKAAGKEPLADSVGYRVEKIDRLLSHVWTRLEPVPVEISGPVGRLITWLDDLNMRCSDFRTTLESGGHMPIDIWKTELQEIVAGLSDLNGAIVGYFTEPSTDPADALKIYQEGRMAYAKNYESLLKKTAK